jgi:rhodanese-related sulfurtransferase
MQINVAGATLHPLPFPPKVARHEPETRMTPLKTTAAAMVAAARARIEEVATEDLIARLGDTDLVIVDIRDIRERQRTGAIPGSVHAPRGMIEFWVDPDSPYHKPVFAQDGKTYVFHCASGWRSALTVATLTDMGFAAAHLRDGFTSWVEAGGPVDEVPHAKS